MSGATEEAVGPTAVDYTTVTTLPHEELKELAHLIHDRQREIDEREKIIEGYREQLQLILIAHAAPKTLTIERYITVTQREGSKPRETFDQQLAIRLLGERLKVDPEKVNEVFADCRKKGKPGEPGITVTVMKEGL